MDAFFTQLFAEYGDEEKQAFNIDKIVDEFCAIAKDAMIRKDDHVTMPTTLCALLACILETRGINK